MEKIYIVMKKSGTGLDTMVHYASGFTDAYAFMVRHGLTEHYIAKVLTFDNVTPVIR